MKRSPILLSLLLIAAGASTAASGREPIEGLWRNRPNTLAVRIAPCGAAWCGTVVSAAADAKASVRNAGNGNLVGTQVLTQLRRSSTGAYAGQVFNPNLNIHAAGTISLVTPNLLLVRGCVLAGLICRQQHWIRVD